MNAVSYTPSGIGFQLTPGQQIQPGMRLGDWLVDNVEVKMEGYGAATMLVKARAMEPVFMSTVSFSDTVVNHQLPHSPTSKPAMEDYNEHYDDTFAENDCPAV